MAHSESAIIANLFPTPCNALGVKEGECWATRTGSVSPLPNWRTEKEGVSRRVEVEVAAMSTALSAIASNRWDGRICHFQKFDLE